MGAFKLGKMTFGSLFKKPETVLYPQETKLQPMGLKGHIEVFVDDCILCGMCERSCTTSCIAVDKAERTWSINRLQCVQCGYCATVCPKKCLSMNPNYAPATTERKLDSYTVPEQAKPAAKKAVDSSVDKPASQVAASNAETPASQAAAAEPAPAACKDSQLEALMAMMDPEKADKVRAAL